MQYPAHGANVASLYEGLQIPMPSTIIDLSENTNSLGTPIELQTMWPELLKKVMTYPHEQAEPFKSQVAAFHGIKPKHIAVCNGASEGLMAIAQFLRGQTVALLEPSFSEYQRTLLQHGCSIVSIPTTNIETYLFSDEQLHQALQQAKALYICNPNNPTGVVQSKQWIESLVQAYPGKYFIIDEAFMDWTDEKNSVISLVTSYPNLLVLRSMTKMFAMAGVRLGYIVSQLAQSIGAFFPHWNVSGIAIALGCKCLELTQFVAHSRKQSNALRIEMQSFFKRLNCRVTNSEVNFFTFCLPPTYDAEHFYMSLLQQGIVLRHTKNYEVLCGEWFRIAVKDVHSWQICEEAIEKYVQND